MRFADPIWLLSGAGVVALVVLLLVRAELLRGRALALLAGAGARLGRARTGLPSPARRWLRVVVVAFAVAMGFCALARPQKGTRWETVTRKGIDVLFVVDTSRSMDADDVKPTRLSRAKLAIRDLVEKFPGDRIGLVAFAGDAFVQSPMTLDHTALLETLDDIDTSVVSPGGTNIGRAIDVGAAAMATEPDQQKEMVLVSDGEDLEGQGLAEAKKARAQGITIDTIGVGSARGELVPAKDAKGATVGLVRDEAGTPVRSHLDEAGLRAIAEASRGAYQPLGSDGQGLERLYAESLAPRAHVEASSRTHRVYAEWFEVPLALALSAMLTGALLALPWRRRRRGRAAGFWVAPAGLGLVLLLTPSLARASVARAQKAYAAHRFDEAASAYAAESEKDPKNAALAFDAGDAAYRAGQFDAADKAFQRALAAKDPKLQRHVLYNRGDALYRSGDVHKAKDRDRTIEEWKSAIGSFEGAMMLDPGDADARYNRDLVARQLAALEQQKQDERRKNEEQKPQDQKQDKGKNDQKQGQGQSPSPSGTKTGQPTGAAGPRGQHGAGPGAEPPGAGSQEAKPADNAAPGARSPRPSPAPSGPTTDPGTPDKTESAEPGRLSSREARALLGSLRGEERHGRGHVAGSPDAGVKADDDTSRKDW